MRRNYMVTVRRICTAVALVMVTAGGIPALAPAALASPAVTTAATHSTPPRIHPHNADDCMGVLASYGYKTKPIQECTSGISPARRRGTSPTL